MMDLIFQFYDWYVFITLATMVGITFTVTGDDLIEWSVGVVGCSIIFIGLIWPFTLIIRIVQLLFMRKL